jgi:hypothetical protein
VDALPSFARDADKDPLQPARVLGIVKDAVELCARRFQPHAIELHSIPSRGSPASSVAPFTVRADAQTAMTP